MKLSVSNLAIERSGHLLLSGITLELHDGEALIVTGENGSGKSTLLRGIAGLLPLVDGMVELFDENDRKFEGETREYCHYLGHQNGMKSTLTVSENLQFWRDFLGTPELTVEEALDEVDLLHTGDLPYGYLSAGQKRRVAIARLLVADRPVWILDEPTSSLDSTSADKLVSLVREFCSSGGIVVMATHSPMDLKKTKALHLSGSDAGSAT